MPAAVALLAGAWLAVAVWASLRATRREAAAREVVEDNVRLAALLEAGPLNDADLFVDWSLSATQRLRKHHWWPIITPVRMLFWIAFWPGPLSQVLYERFRPRVRLPAEWTESEALLPGEANLYVASVPDAAERAGRRKAAWIVGVTCGICIAIGIAFSCAVLWLELIPFAVTMWRDTLGAHARVR